MEKRGEKNRKEQKEHITTDFEILYWINTEKEEKKIQWRIAVVCTIIGAIALSYPPPIVIDDSSWKNAAESFTVALTLTLGGYESAIARFMLGKYLKRHKVVAMHNLKRISFSLRLRRFRGQWNPYAGVDLSNAGVRYIFFITLQSHSYSLQ